MATRASGGDIRDISLAVQGEELVEWAAGRMPVLQSVRRRLEREKPLRGLRVSASLDVTSETANLVIALKGGGADIALCGSDPGATDDAVAAALVDHHEIATYAARGEDEGAHRMHLAAALAHRPHLTVDAGAHLATALHRGGGRALGLVLGGTTGFHIPAGQDTLRYPIIAVGETPTARLFEHHGAAQSTIETIVRANVLLAGTTLAVAGYGGTGRQVAARARGHGAHVVVTETDPVRALEACLEGFQVLSSEEAAKVGDVFASPAEVRLADGRRLAPAERRPAPVEDVSLAIQALCTAHLARHCGRLEPALHAVPPEIDAEVARLTLATIGVLIDTWSREERT